MGLFTIALIVAFVSVLSFIELPKMIQRHLYKELVLFSAFLLFGCVAGIMVSIGIKVYNPSDTITFILSPLVHVVKLILG